MKTGRRYQKQNKMSSKQVTVSYCQNWDGGKQERDTAVAAVKASGIANLEITTKELDEYPVKVSISVPSSGEVLWSGPQRRLFRKYAADREASIAEITAAVKKHFAQ